MRSFWLIQWKLSCTSAVSSLADRVGYKWSKLYPAVKVSLHRVLYISDKPSTDMGIIGPQFWSKVTFSTTAQVKVIRRDQANLNKHQGASFKSERYKAWPSSSLTAHLCWYRRLMEEFKLEKPEGPAIVCWRARTHADTQLSAGGGGIHPNQWWTKQSLTRNSGRN